jgi:hypothetical protein
MLKRIDDLIARRVDQALSDNGILESERELYEIGIIPAPRFMDPQNPNPDEMLYAALVFMAYPIPLRPLDRVENHFQLREPYGPPEMYKELVGGVVRKISAELAEAGQEGSGVPGGYDRMSAGGLILP